MEKILFLAHTESDGSLGKSTLEALTAAKQLADGLGQPFSVALLGEDVAAAAEVVGGCGAQSFCAVSGADFAQSRYASDAAALEALCKHADASIVIGAATSRFARVLPGVAQRLGGRVDTQLTGLDADGGVSISRWYYRQRMVADITREQRPWVLSISPGCFDAYAGDASAPSVDVVAVDLGDAAAKTTVTGVEAPAADEQTIRPEAEMLFVTGAGWTKKQADGQTKTKDAEELILNFMGKSGASLGSSKSLVDQGGDGEAVLSFLTHMHQVGQTGSTPRHAKGLATCCHGEEPHVVGWRFINDRRAVNTDESCGWAQGKADVLYVADAFEVMKKVNELLEK